MFKQRLFTALLLIPLVLLTLLYANTWVLALVLGLITALLAWEWTNLIPIQPGIWQWAYVLVTELVAIAVLQFFSSLEPLVILMWLGFFVAILAYPKYLNLWGRSGLIGLIGVLSLSFFVAGFWGVYHSPQGILLVFYVLAIVWATDIGGYLFGKVLGRHRLIPKVSPGKTLVGTLGGVVSALALAAIALIYIHPKSIAQWFIDALVLIALAVVGDLAISMLKRRVKLKDTGALLPGHGGILDRLDSLIAVMPFAYYLIHGTI